MTADFDLRRLEELGPVLGESLPETLATLRDELTRATQQTQAAVRARDWAGAERAAHAGRNSALILNAGPLLDVLGRVEQAARERDAGAADAAADRLGRVWADLRSGLETAAGRDGPPHGR